MPTLSTNESTIGVTAFKAQCLGLIDDVAQGKTDRIVLLKHNRPIAAVVPLRDLRSLGRNAGNGHRRSRRRSDREHRRDLGGGAVSGRFDTA
jgi:antitoxin (DNA-binding transcriptional repressor) of toxin-antitoxin stability system